MQILLFHTVTICPATTEDCLKVNLQDIMDHIKMYEDTESLTFFIPTYMYPITSRSLPSSMTCTRPPTYVYTHVSMHTLWHNYTQWQTHTHHFPMHSSILSLPHSSVVAITTTPLGVTHSHSLRSQPFGSDSLSKNSKRTRSNPSISFGIHVICETIAWREVRVLYLYINLNTWYTMSSA